jgi:hypothetical protein
MFGYRFGRSREDLLSTQRQQNDLRDLISI